MTRRSWAAVAARDVVRRRYVAQALRSVPARAPATFSVACHAVVLSWAYRVCWADLAQPLAHRG